MGDNDLDWPTFAGDDTRVSYSPDAEKELMFEGFIPKTEDPKKRKKKKKKPTLRLVSESDLEEERKQREARRKCMIIAIIITCIVIIIAICTILGIYFGVIAKDSPGGPIHSASNGSEITVTVQPLPSSPPPSTSTIKSTKPLTKPPTSTKTTTKPTTTTSTTTTTTTTTSTTTTTTTTTTPAPTTEPPVIPYTNDDLPNIIEKARLCVSRISITTVVDNLSKDEKCSLYKSMVLCAYTSVLQEKILCDVNTLTEIIANNTRKVIPFYISIDPLQCKEPDGSFNADNITTLPVTTEELCYSPDVVQYLWSYGCHVTYTVEQFQQESDETKCMLYFGIIGCISQNLSCTYEDIDSVVMTYNDKLDHKIDFNLTTCKELYGEMILKDPCNLQLYKNMETVSANCSQVLVTDNPAITGNSSLQCSLFKEYSRCTVRQAYGSQEMSYCLQIVSSDLLKAAVEFTGKVNAPPYFPPLLQMHHCGDWRSDDTSICTDSSRIINIVDALCYKIAAYAYGTDTCSYLRSYIYDCGVDALNSLKIQCFPEQIRDAFLADPVLQDRYSIDFRAKVTRDCKDQFS